ncbi:MAG TPA: redoxin domain-containing protein [Actinobacteria bacterium]|nr:putative peroxiredoxin/MT2597 [bacterium BMS3Bbin01]HDH26075.1 redoxin domain-containing protein [Actinomycetota bacterium]
MSRGAVKARKRPQPKRRASIGKWLGFGIPIAGIVGLVLFGVLSSGPDEAVVSSAAPDFSLPTTDGTMVSLQDLMAQGGDVLLYFSMGVGCDGCFAQIPEIADDLAAKEITFAPIMVNPADQVAADAARFGITTPILIDNSRKVSSAYGMIGVYGHADRPAHSFALVGKDGTIKWVHHYAKMFVPADEFMKDLGSSS